MNIQRALIRLQSDRGLYWGGDSGGSSSSSSSSSSGGLSTSNGGLTKNSNGTYTVNNTSTSSTSSGSSSSSSTVSDAEFEGAIAQDTANKTTTGGISYGDSGYSTSSGTVVSSDSGGSSGPTQASIDAAKQAEAEAAAKAAAEAAAKEAARIEAENLEAANLKIAELNKANLSWAEQNDVLNKELGELQGQYSAVLDLNGTLNTNYFNLENDYGLLQSKMGDLDTQYNSLQNDFNDLNTTYESLNGNYADLDKNYSTLKGNYQQSLDDIAAARAQYQSTYDALVASEEAYQEQRAENRQAAAANRRDGRFGVQDPRFPGNQTGLLNGNMNELMVDFGNTGYNINTAPYTYRELAATDMPAGADPEAWEKSKASTLAALTGYNTILSTAKDPIAQQQTAETFWKQYPESVDQALSNMDRMAGDDLADFAAGDLVGPPMGNQVTHAGTTTFAAEEGNGAAGVLGTIAGAFIPGAGLLINGAKNADQANDFSNAFMARELTGTEKFKSGLESTLTNKIPGADWLRNNDPNAFYANYDSAPSDVSSYDSADEFIKAKGIDPESPAAQEIMKNWDFWNNYGSHLNGINFGNSGNTYGRTRQYQRLPTQASETAAQARPTTSRSSRRSRRNTESN